MNEHMIGTIDDFAKAEVSDRTKNGVCSQCGNCCGRLLPVSDDEIRIIKQYVKKHNVKQYVSHFFNPSYLYFNCPFCDNGKEKERCRIYEVRPEICRAFKCDLGKLPEDFDPRKYKTVDMVEVFYGGK